MVPNVMLYLPTAIAFTVILIPVTFAATDGQRWHVTHLCNWQTKAW